MNVRQPMKIDGVPVPLDPSKPAMLTFYVGFPQSGVPIDVQTSAARGRLFGTTYADFELQIRKQLQQMFGDSGFDARRDIAGIIINRWGHAYIAPQPGFYFGGTGNPAPLEVIRERHGRISFGHSELSAGVGGRKVDLHPTGAILVHMICAGFTYIESGDGVWWVVVWHRRGHSHHIRVLHDKIVLRQHSVTIEVRDRNAVASNNWLSRWKHLAIDGEGIVTAQGCIEQ